MTTKKAVKLSHNDWFNEAVYSMRCENHEEIANVLGLITAKMPYGLYCNFNAFLVRHKMMSGDTKAAQNFIDEHEYTLLGNVSLNNIYTAFTLCRAYIKKNNFEQAIVLITKILKLSNTLKRPLDIIESLILLSIVYWKKKKQFQEEALRYLKLAITTAYPYKFTQIFINDASHIEPMMLRLQKQMEQQNDKKQEILTFIRKINLKMPKNLIADINSIEVNYTKKQKAVMAHLCEGKSYKQIATALGISITTIRSHLALIYKKLDVTDQKNAVFKIRTMGLLG